ncbi:MAG: hypothetical protein ACKVQR_15145 [Aquabacterium sp.]
MGAHTWVLSIAALASALALPATAQTDRVVVNAQPLTAATLAQLQRLYPVAIAPGRYWYDAVSGLYGAEGGPPAGQMAPGLALGGPLRADASRGTMPVFINGRQLTEGEVRYIALSCQTAVAPGRYWVTAWGLGGFEGGPAVFNLALCRPPGGGGGGGGGGSSSRTWCDPSGACTSTGILGSITTAPR